jgi:hypothetical protein
VINILKLTSYNALVRNRTPLVLLNVFNDEKDGYFRAVFIVQQKGLVFFRRRSGDLSLKRYIKHELYPLLMDDYTSTLIKT